MTISNAIPAVKRVCGDCDACCQGWLSGQAYGHRFYPGKSCFYKLKIGCSIYPDRPVEPCVNFLCAWRTEDIFPIWFRPDQSNVLITKQRWGTDRDQIYFKVFECGKKIDSAILNQIFMIHLTHRIPIAVQVDSGWNFYGGPEFIEEMMNPNPA